MISALALGCADKDSSDGDDGSSPGDDGGGSGGLDDGGSGTGGGGGGGPTDDGHGYVKLQLRRAENQSESPFGGTDSIEVVVTYGSALSLCLEEFYANNPSWQFDGVDGGPVFDAWSDLLCNIDDPEGPVACDTVTIEQHLEDIPTLGLTYNGVSEPIENHVLIIGPLPTAELAGCSGDTLPTVRIVAPSVTGHGGGGTTIWQGLSAPVDKAATGQDAPMKVNVQRTG